LTLFSKKTDKLLKDFTEIDHIMNPQTLGYNPYYMVPF
jgi:hypothetical protein